MFLNGATFSTLPTTSLKLRLGRNVIQISARCNACRDRNSRIVSAGSQDLSDFASHHDGIAPMSFIGTDERLEQVVRLFSAMTAHSSVGVTIMRPSQSIPFWCEISLSGNWNSHNMIGCRGPEFDWNCHQIWESSHTVTPHENVTSCNSTEPHLFEKSQAL
jgi:hypothetical protein